MQESSTTRSLDRDAASDLWRRTLSQIPSVFGRLVYLAGLRNMNSGRYEHHGLGLVFGEDEANKALKRNHSQAFQEWLNSNLEQQKADLDLYLSSVTNEKKSVLENWITTRPYEHLIPGSIRPAERRLYLADLSAILELLRNELGVAGPDPGA